jgi:hypothetical protein
MRLFKLTLLLTIFTLSNQLAYSQSNNEGKAKKQKLSKWQKKARKEEKKAAKWKGKLQALGKKKGTYPSDYKKVQKKIDHYTERKKGWLYKERSIRHIKSQGKAGRKKMKKNLQHHRKSR